MLFLLLIFLQQKIKKSEDEVVNMVLNGPKGNKPKVKTKGRKKRSLIAKGQKWTRCIIPYTFDDNFNASYVTEGERGCYIVAVNVENEEPQTFLPFYWSEKDSQEDS